MFALLSLLVAGYGARAQAPTWQSAITSTGATDTTAAYESAVDAQGNVYIAGLMGGPATSFGATTLTRQGSGVESFVAKLSPSGQWLWAVPVGSPGNILDGGIRVFRVEVDAAGNVYVAGSYDDTLQLGATTLLPILFNPPAINVRDNGFVASLTPQGQWRWAIAPDPATTGYTAIHELAVDAGGAVTVGGEFAITASFGAAGTLLQPGGGYQQGFVAHLTPQGQWAWVQGIDPTPQGGSFDYASVYALALDATGALYLTGSYRGALTLGALPTLPVVTDTDALFVASLSAQGQWRWATAVTADTVGSGPFGTEVEATSLAVDAAGRVFLTGYLSGTASFGATTLAAPGEAFVAALSPRGQWRWAIQSHGGANPVALIWLYGGRVDAARGQLLVVGATSEPATFDAATPVGQNNEPSFVVAFDTATGAGQWAIGGGGEATTLLSVAIGPAGTLYAAGVAADSARFGPVLATPGPGYHAVVAALRQPLGLPATAGAHPLLLAPNPARHTTRLTHAPAGPLYLLDALGRTVRTATVPIGQSEATLDVAGLPPGLYTVRAGSTTRRLVVE